MEHIVLDQGWQLAKVDHSPSPSSLSNTETWYPIPKMPAQVHDVLIKCNEIPEPWLPEEAKKLLWVAESNWCYKTQFSWNRSANKVCLHFGGLDTLAHVFLNEQEILMSDDSFVSWEVDVTDLLLPKNELLVYFPSIAHLEIDEEGERYFYASGEKHILRKMDQDFKEYLGPNPYFIKVGIFADVALNVYDQLQVHALEMDTSISDDLKEGFLQLNLTGTWLQECTSPTIEILVTDQNTIVAKEKFSCKCGEKDFSQQKTLSIHHPKLWWYRGKGKANLYQVTVTVQNDATVLYQKSQFVGFKKIEFKDPFCIECNHEPVRLCGATLGPFDSVSLCWDMNRVTTILDLICNANMNVVRIWGGTGFISDEFYYECDKRGLLVWNDFMNIGIHDKDSLCVQYYKKEIETTVKRLKHHVCILCWCGCNEGYLWHSVAGNGNVLWEEGKSQFDKFAALKEIGSLVKELDSGREYIESSPCKGAFINDPQNGSTHGYTNMWYVPGYDHLHFAAEDTRISAPPVKSLKKFMKPGDLWPEGYRDITTYDNYLPWPETWENYTTSLSYRKTGPIENYYSAATPEELVYKLGAAQADYYNNTVQKYRCGRSPLEQSEYRHGYGYMIWKLNDSWPQIYSSKIDYFLQPGIPYYALKQSYRPFQLFFEVGDHIYLWAVNDTANDISGTVRIKLFNPASNTALEQLVLKVSVQKGESKVLTDLDAFGQFDRENILYAAFYNLVNDKETETHAFVEIERRLRFPKVQLQLRMDQGKLVVSTDRFARAIELTCSDDTVIFDNNYFDLFPQEDQKVGFIKAPCAGSTIHAKAQYNDEIFSIVYEVKEPL